MRLLTGPTDQGVWAFSKKFLETGTGKKQILPPESPEGTSSADTSILAM